jgi:hypothetical protein
MGNKKYRFYPVMFSAFSDSNSGRNLITLPFTKNEVMEFREMPPPSVRAMSRTQISFLGKSKVEKRI